MESQKELFNDESSEQSQYKMKINKNLLYEFLLCEEEEMGKVHIEEVYKVIAIVINKYFSSYSYMKSELQAQTFSVILDRRSGFDPDKDAYNYIFTQSRNEVGNCLAPSTKVLCKVKGQKKILSIKNIVNNNLECQVMSYSIAENKFEFCDVIGWHKNGVKEIYAYYFITPDSEFRLRCTEDHPILTCKGYKMAKDLSFGDTCYVYDETENKLLWALFRKRSTFGRECNVYCLDVAKNHNFVANNVVVHNCIYRWNKEFHSEDNLNYREPGCDIDVENLDLPTAIVKYAHYLSGEVDFTIKRVAKKDAIDILLFLKVNERKTIPKAPDFLLENKKSVDVLYKVIKDLISE